MKSNVPSVFGTLSQAPSVKVSGNRTGARACSELTIFWSALIVFISESEFSVSPHTHIHHVILFCSPYSAHLHDYRIFVWSKSYILGTSNEVVTPVDMITESHNSKVERSNSPVCRPTEQIVVIPRTRRRGWYTSSGLARRDISAQQASRKKRCYGKWKNEEASA
jgi:hypothetical protein